jgi:hypothetical protein
MPSRSSLANLAVASSSLARIDAWRNEDACSSNVEMLS